MCGGGSDAKEKWDDCTESLYVGEQASAYLVLVKQLQ